MEDMVEKIQRDLGAHNLDLGGLGGFPWEGGYRVKDWQGQQCQEETQALH